LAVKAGAGLRASALATAQRVTAPSTPKRVRRKTLRGSCTFVIVRDSDIYSFASKSELGQSSEVKAYCKRRPPLVSYLSYAG